MADAPAIDLEAVFGELALAHPGHGKYEPIDRYRDFRAVFLATDQGKRVLYEILSFGRMFKSSAWPQFDAHQTMYHEGERNLALRILTTINAEPVDKPTRAVSSYPTEREGD